MSHAILSPSSSARWTVCTPSAQLNANLPDQPTSYAQEGTMAHSIAETKVRIAIGEKADLPSIEDAEMNEATDLYRDFVMEQLELAKQICKDPAVYVEQHVSAEKYAPGCYGTADCIIISDNVLHIIDLKYGQLEVSAQHNTQLQIYSLGAVEAFSALYDFDTVKMSIFQPRRSNYDTFTISVEELLKWGEEVLKPKAELAMKGEGEFSAGEHCRFCKIKNTCRKRAEYNLMLAKYDFAMPDTLEDDEISIILDRADSLVSWINDIKEYALTQAIAGKQFTGYKVVAGRSTRKYTDEKAVAETVSGAGFDPYEHKVLGITAMTKLLGKKKFDSLLGTLIEKPQGKPTLVSNSDKRPKWNTANEDFQD